MSQGTTYSRQVRRILDHDPEDLAADSTQRRGDEDIVDHHADEAVEKTPELAKFYSTIIASAAGRSGLTAYRFQAFDWPGSETQPIPVQGSLGVVSGKKTYTAASLPGIGAVFANELSSTKGSKITVPKTVTLPSGKAEFIEGTIPIGSGIENGLELYLIPHGKTVYELAFQIEASQLKTATLFTAIAKEFKIL